MNPKNKLGFNLKSHIKNLKEYILKNDIDLIHAHNIYCANLAEKLDIPLVFDDHEFFSGRLHYFSPSPIKYKEFFSHQIIKIRYPKWENNIVKKYPVITTKNIGVL